MKKSIPKIMGGFKKVRGMLDDKREEITSYGGVFIGLVFIIIGALYLSSPVKKIADNVIFGEQAVISILFIIIGIIVIAGALKQKIISKTPLADIYTEMKAIENEKDKNDEKNNIK